MEVIAGSINEKLQQVLDKRIDESLYRQLQAHSGLVDFCSNDYLSFARSAFIKEQAAKYVLNTDHLSGATGSRSISGNTVFAEELEQYIAAFHRAEAGLLFNSGYDANLGLFSCIAKKDDTIICDELIHASIIDGCRLSYATRLRFAHNDTSDLERKLQQARGHVFVAVESVYSMDGDKAPLAEIAALCEQYQANLIVDEAHGTGVFGPNGRGLVCENALEEKVFARVHTFGKAIGSHGAIVLGSNTLRNYLVNFARSFIFTTALPFHSLATIRAAYDALANDTFDNKALHDLIHYFKNDLEIPGSAFLIPGEGPIQSLIIPGNENAKAASRQLQSLGFDVRAILSPSVPTGKERLRISLHLHNSKSETDQLKQALLKILAK